MGTCLAQGNASACLADILPMRECADCHLQNNFERFHLDPYRTARGGCMPPLMAGVPIEGACIVIPIAVSVWFGRIGSTLLAAIDLWMVCGCKAETDASRVSVRKSGYEANFTTRATSVAHAISSRVCTLTLPYSVSSRRETTLCVLPIFLAKSVWLKPIFSRSAWI